MITNCPKCDSLFENKTKWGVKKFCSRKCSNSRVQTSESNLLRKVSNKKQLPCVFCQKICGSEGALAIHERSCTENPNRIPGTFFGRKHSIETKKKQARSFAGRDPGNLFILSKRTISKILKRLGAVCSNCGWERTSCDIHHIVPKSKGGTDHHTNLTVLCPNCHRLAHEKKLTDFISFEVQYGEKWREVYFSHI